MQVLFRADASARIGSGHIMRCLTLAEALRDREVEVAFVARPLEGNLNGLLRERGFAVQELSDLSSATVAGAEAPLADWHSDARATRAAIGALGPKPDWLVLDHYGLDYRWQRELQGLCTQLMVIDDLANRQHACDLLLDQNLVAEMDVRYAGRVPEPCTLLLGPRYALLQPSYAESHQRIKPRTGLVRRICIYFGAADRVGMTQLALRALLSLQLREVAVDVVWDGGASHLAELRACAAGHGNVRIHGRQPTLAALWAAADLAIGAAGATSWERLCLGVPSLIVTLEENQRPVAAALQQRGLADWLGHYDEIGIEALQSALARHIASGADSDASRAAQLLVDGLGVGRVCAALLVNGKTVLRARHAGARDEELLLHWANDPTTRQNSFNPQMIAADEHHRWLRERLSAGANCVLLVIETEEGVPLATVRFDRTDAAWNINYSLAAEYRGRGLGPRIVELALEALLREHPGPTCIQAQVRATNEPSRRVFRRLGFQMVSSTATAVEYRRSV
jgi:UDP-2,4-diacetamido-2,4,6-trideoxy-beta-L-altropyranose hydrolase